LFGFQKKKTKSYSEKGNKVADSEDEFTTPNADDFETIDQALLAQKEESKLTITGLRKIYGNKKLAIKHKVT